MEEFANNISVNMTDNLWADGASKMSEDFSKNILFLTIIIGFVIFMGFFGNLCVIVVYRLKYPRCNFKYFVICLALIDMISCCTTIPGEVYTQSNWFSFPESNIWFCKLKVFCNGFTVFVSAFILLLIAIDRYRKVCQPLKWQIKPTRAIQLSGMIFAIAFVLAIPSLILWGAETDVTEYQGRNVLVTMCGKADATKTTIWPSIYLYFIFFIPTVAFMLSTAVLYVLIMRVIFFGSLAVKSFRVSLKQKKGFNMNAKPSANDSRITADSDNTIETDDEISADGDSDGAMSTTANSEVQTATTTVSYVSKRNAAKKDRIANARMRLRRKTMIMFVLTVVFLVTTVMYFCMLTYVVRQHHTFMLVSKTAAVYLVIWRMYFINHIINPIVYGFMDPRFRHAVKEMMCVRCQ